jgi:hypothetical protein
MLPRVLVALLALSNLALFGWTHGWLDGLTGMPARGQREPERMQQQLQPERVQLLAPQSAAALKRRSCLELPPLDGEAALQAAQAVLTRAGLSPADWQLQHSELPGQWALATIRLGSRDFQARKEETYKRLKISYEFLQGLPDEMPSLILGRFSSAKAAEAALANHAQRSLKGLRVLQLQPAQTRYLLQLPQVDGLQEAHLRALKEAALGGGVKACSAAAAAAAASASSSSAAASAASAASGH